MINGKAVLPLLLLMPVLAAGQNDAARRKQYLEDSQRINIKQQFKSNTRRVSVQDSTWSDWLRRTGELPPDFSKMRSVPNLPDPLMLMKDGVEVPVKTMLQWEEKRKWIKSEYQQWISGRFPDAPKNLVATVLSDRTEGGTRIQMIRLNFGPGHKAMMTMELMIPAGAGAKPVYMTQWNHREWAQLAVRRGYIGCVYAAADVNDNTEAYMALYPDYDFSMLMRRAWGASRVVDYLCTRPEVNTKQIAITGHSRNGKQSLWAAAFDERITAVVSSSSSTGGDSPWRYGDPQFASETIDLVTAYNGHWFHPRLRFFFGREDRLPVDQNLLAALIAPRPLLFHYSIVERGLNPWSIEQNYQSVRRVYNFLQAPDKVGVLSRMGEHAVAARDVEKSIDFLDIQFRKTRLTWQNQLYYAYDQSIWERNHPADQLAAKSIGAVKLQEKYPDIAAFETERLRIREKLSWLLGEEPPGVKALPAAESERSRQDWIDNTIGRPDVKGAKAIYLGPYSSMGDHLPGILYCPADESGKVKLPEKGKLPLVIYLHEYAYATGYAKGYNKAGGGGNANLFRQFIQKGFAVLSIDMIGFGARIDEGTNFYDRFSNWSKMGKMVTDVRGCVDAMVDMEHIDANNIFLLGNTIGGAVGLFSSALDERVAGTAIVAAVSPSRSANAQYQTLDTYSRLHGFMPRLGFFRQQPQSVPVDFAEVMAAMAPRPLMVVAPDMDRHTDLQALKTSLEPVKAVYSLYGAGHQLSISHPHEINRISPEMLAEIVRFYQNNVK